ncbi:ABC transporter C-terminal domain-containing protein, partial [Phocaeicola dorei]|uniref:ABC transporter C-terminal domain-containing protein n=1 Tax=Phocaeicola dorei TaxID=357276 RepID=UPI00374E152A
MQRQVDQLENQMGELEGKQAAIEAEMAKPEIAVDIAQLTDLQKKLDALKAQSEDVELQWT